MSVMLRTTIVAVYLYGIPALVGLIPYYLIISKDTDVAIAFFIFGYVLTFLVEIMSHAEIFDKYIEGKVN